MKLQDTIAAVEKFLNLWFEQLEKTGFRNSIVDIDIFEMHLLPNGKIAKIDKDIDIKVTEKPIDVPDYHKSKYWRMDIGIDLNDINSAWYYRTGTTMNWMAQWIWGMAVKEAEPRDIKRAMKEAAEHMKNTKYIDIGS